MKNSLSKIAAAAALAVTAFGAQAVTVVVSNYTYTPAAELTVDKTPPPNYAGMAGQFTGMLDGNSFLTYCTEIGVDIIFGTTYTDFSVVNGVTAWGATKAADLGKLMTYAQTYVTNATTSAVMQAAVWEVIYETIGTYSFSTGDLKVSDSPIGSPGIQTALNSFSWATVNGTVSTYTVDKLVSPSAQDLLIAIPEPGTYALMAAGLLAIGLRAQRRSRQG